MSQNEQAKADAFAGLLLCLYRALSVIPPWRRGVTRPAQSGASATNPGTHGVGHDKTTHAARGKPTGTRRR